MNFSRRIITNMQQLMPNTRRRQRVVPENDKTMSIEEDDRTYKSVNLSEAGVSPVIHSSFYTLLIMTYYMKSL